MESGFRPAVNSIIKWALIVVFTPLYYVGIAFAFIGIAIYMMTYVTILTAATAIFHIFVFFEYVKSKIKRRCK